MYIYIRQYVISSSRALTKMAKIGTWRIIINLQYFIVVNEGIRHFLMQIAVKEEINAKD